MSTRSATSGHWYMDSAISYITTYHACGFVGMVFAFASWWMSCVWELTECGTVVGRTWKGEGGGVGLMAQRSRAQHSTAQRSTAQHSTAQHCTALICQT